MHDVVEPLAAEVNRLAGADLSMLSAVELSEVVLDLQRLAARVEAQAVRAVGCWDAKQGWEPDGARNAAAWLKWKAHLPDNTARRRVRLARQLRGMPVTEAAWQAGDIDVAHVNKLCSARREHLAGEFAAHEQLLVDTAGQTFYRSFCRAVDYWLQAADPDGAERDEAARQRDRSFELHESWQGMWFGSLTLDPVSGQIVSSMLTRIEAELFAADVAEARQRLGEDYCGLGLRRTGTQRRADALVEMARRAGTAPADGKRPAPLFTVYVGYETFAGRICELAGGTVLAPGALVPWLDEAYIERAVWDGESRVVDLGPQRRLFTGATRRILELEHPTCYHPGCDMPAEQCEADHIFPYAMGGLTVYLNGRMACAFHNRLRQRQQKPRTLQFSEFRPFNPP